MINYFPSWLVKMALFDVGKLKDIGEWFVLPIDGDIWGMVYALRYQVMLYFHPSRDCYYESYVYLSDVCLNREEQIWFVIRFYRLQASINVVSWVNRFQHCFFDCRFLSTCPITCALSRDMSIVFLAFVAYVPHISMAFHFFAKGEPQ